MNVEGFVHNESISLCLLLRNTVEWGTTFKMSEGKITSRNREMTPQRPYE